MKHFYTILALCAAPLLHAQVTATLTGSTTSCSSPCNGTLDFSATGGTPPYTYTISPMNQSNSTGSFTGLCAGTYTMIVTDQASGADTITAGVTMIPAPTITSVNITPISPPNNFQAEVFYSGGQAPYYIQWMHLPSMNTIRLDTSLTSSDTISHLVPGDYGLFVTDSVNMANGCGTNQPYPFSICDPNAGAGLITVTPNDTVCTGTTITVQYTIMPFFQPDMIAPMFVSDNPNCDPSQSNGTFTCTITQTTTFSGGWAYAMGCPPVPFPSLTVVVDPCTGVSEASPAKAVNVFPNPAGSQFSVSLPGSETAAISIRDQQGRVCFTTIARDGETIAPRLPAGLYTCTVETAGGISNIKLVLTGE